MREFFRRRHLPHWDVPGATYFVTSVLDGSIPAQGVLDLQRLDRELELQTRPPDLSEPDWHRLKWKRLFAKCDEWLDLRPAVRYFDDPRLALEIQASMRHFADERYKLFAYVVMPSHFHWLFRPCDDWVRSLGESANTRTPRERIMSSLKRFSANQCNRILGRQGRFWLEESYDHVVRDEYEMQRILDYIELNPVKAGLVANRNDWPYSSAHR